MDRQQSLTYVCTGGENEAIDLISQGEQFVGSARLLQNYEPASDRGYQSILGYSKATPVAVPNTGPIRGVFVFNNTLIAAREGGVFYWNDPNWVAIGSNRPNVTGRYRFDSYTFAAPTMSICDGANFCQLWDGTTLTTVNGTGAPTAPEYATYHAGRLALAQGTIVSLSASNDASDFDGANGAVAFNVGRRITGLKEFRNELYVFCDKAIHKISGSYAGNFQLSTVTSDLGCVSSDTIQEIGGDLLFLAPDGLRPVSQTERIDDVEISSVSEPIKSKIAQFVSKAATENICSLVVQRKSQYRLFLHDATSSDASAMGIIAKLNPALENTYEFTTLRGIPAYSSATGFISSVEWNIFGHASDGHVYRMESGNSFDGRSIPTVYSTPYFTFGDLAFRKTLYKVHYIMRLTNTLSANMRLEFDYGDVGELNPPAIPINKEVSVSEYGTAVYGTAKYSTQVTTDIQQYLIGSCKNASLQLSSSTTNGPHRIDNMLIEYSPEGRI